MSLFVWNKQYALGHKEIDEQHQRLFQMADELHRAMMERRGKEALSGLLKRLLDYTVYHFGAEEKLMRETAYPAYLQHRNEHLELTRIATQHQQKLLKGEGSVSIEVLQFLSDWLQVHIGGSDQKVAMHLKNCRKPVAVG
jgi:hemerythrin-like metal-binding protein